MENSRSSLLLGFAALLLILQACGGGGGGAGSGSENAAAAPVAAAPASAVASLASTASGLAALLPAAGMTWATDQNLRLSLTVRGPDGLAVSGAAVRVFTLSRLSPQDGSPLAELQGATALSEWEAHTRDEVVAAFTAERTNDALLAAMEAAVARLDAGEALADVASSYGVFPQLSSPFTRFGAEDGTIDAAVAFAAFAGGADHHGSGDGAGGAVCARDGHGRRHRWHALHAA